MSPAKDSSIREDFLDKKPGFIEYIEKRNSDGLSEMLVLRAIPSMFLSFRRHGITEFRDNVVRLWIVDMLMDGHKISTIKRYVGAVHMLYKEWASATDSEYKETIFSLPCAWSEFESTPGRLKEVEENLVAAERLTRSYVKQNSPAFIYTKAFQYLLFDPLVTLRDIVNLKFSDTRPDCLHLEDIVLSMRNAPQAKYVFPLQQGKRREPAIIKDLLVELHATAKRAGLKFGESFSRDSITSLWIAAAVKEDVAYSEIRGVIPNLPAAYSFLSLIDGTNVGEKKMTEILNRVAYSISNKNPGWFVLRLRNGVTPDKIKMRLKEKESPLQRQIQYYYPLHSVKKLENKKVVTVETPVIPGLLFIRLPHDQVSPLISIIGDLAWCYRTTSNPASPYSVIPQSEMRIFQRCVGAFTEDIEMDIVSELPALKVGDEVMIEDGSLLDGQVATIRRVKSVDGTQTYTLRLSDTAFIKWNDIKLPASHISKVEK